MLTKANNAMKQFSPTWQPLMLTLLVFLTTATLFLPAAQAQTLSSSTNAIDYGFVPVDGTVSQLVTLTNPDATASLTINGVNFFGTDTANFDFLFPEHDPFTAVALAPGETVDVYLFFTPSQGGTHTALIEFVYSGVSAGPSVLINLEGDGCANFDPGTPGDPYQETGGKVTIEVESQGTVDDWISYTYAEGDTIYMDVDTTITPDTTIYDTTKVETAPDDMTFYTWEGNNNTGWTGGGNITYTFNITDVSESYRLMMRSDNNPDSISTAANDIWFHFDDPGVVVRLENPNEPLPPPNDTVTVKEVQGIWFKAFNSVGAWTWFTNGAVNIDGVWFEGFTNIQVHFPSPGTYSFTIAGRAAGFSVDKFALWQNGFPNGGEDPVSGTAPAPECPTIWFQDADSDTYGNALATAASLGQPAGYVDNDIDCDDNAATTNPFASEINGDLVDNNCDGYVDEGFATAEGCTNVRINAGSEADAYTTPGGDVFGLDLGYTSSPTKDDYTGPAPAMANTAFDELYHTLRSTILSAEDIAGTDTLDYAINVGDKGVFLVKLHFAELFWDFPGQRVFDIVMEEGNASEFTLAGFDILAQTGGAKNTAVVVTQEMVINDSVLNLSLRPTANKPVIAGIEILPLESCGEDGVIFPVEWVAFEAAREGSKVALNWKTAREINNDFFTVERSTNGLRFEPMMEVDAAGGEYVQTYQVYDQAPARGINYYRVKQTDLDGNFSYSHTVEVMVENTAVSVYPNPLQPGQTLTVALELQQRDHVQLELLNSIGQVVARQSASLGRGQHEHAMELEQLGQGYYFLRVSSRNGTEVHKIVVTK